MINHTMDKIVANGSEDVPRMREAVQKVLSRLPQQQPLLFANVAVTPTISFYKHCCYSSGLLPLKNPKKQVHQQRSMIIFRPPGMRRLIPKHFIFIKWGCIKRRRRSELTDMCARFSSVNAGLFCESCLCVCSGCSYSCCICSNCLWSTELQPRTVTCLAVVK